MKYLLEVEWTDTVASDVGRILAALPDEVEPTTSLVPRGRTRGFIVVSADDPKVLDGVTRAVTAAGAEVRVVAGHEG